MKARGAGEATRWRGLTTAVTVGVSVLGALFTLLWLTGSGDDVEGAASPGSDASGRAMVQVPGSPVREASFCGLDAVALSGWLVTPPEVEWALVGTTAAPGSSRHGPGVLDEDGFRSCYARTPEGALLAVANIVAMGSDPDLRPRIADALLAEGQGRDRAMRDIGEPPATNVRVQIQGFQVLDYTGETAVIDIAVRTSRDAHVSQVLTVVWQGGEWKAQVAPDGQFPVGVTQIPDLTGYVPWAGT